MLDNTYNGAAMCLSEYHRNFCSQMVGCRPKLGIKALVASTQQKQLPVQLNKGTFWHYSFPWSQHDKNQASTIGLLCIKYIITKVSQAGIFNCALKHFACCALLTWPAQFGRCSQLASNFSSSGCNIACDCTTHGRLRSRNSRINGKSSVVVMD